MKMNNLTIFISIIFIQFFSISFAQNWDNYEGRRHPDKTFHSLDGRLKNSKKINETKTRLKLKKHKLKRIKKVKVIKPPEIINDTNQITPRITPLKTKPIKPARNNRWNYWINGLVFTVLLCLILLIISRINTIRSCIASFRNCPLIIKIAIALLISLIITGCYLIIFNPKL